MSDIEEPPSKMSKYEEYLDETEEGLEEGQEEWLSEGVLTDDDYHISTADQDKTDSNLEETTQEDHDTMTSNPEMETLDETNGSEKGADQKLEDTLNNLDSKHELPEDLDAFLVRKTDLQSLENKIKKEIKEDDDGNDTDDLLRLLEDNQQVKKKAIKLVKTGKNENQVSSDDDEFIYERSKVKTLKLAKNALIKRIPSKAEPEHSDTDDETDASSDGGNTMQRMFGVKGELKKTSKKPNEQSKRVVKHVAQVKNTHNKPKPQHKSILKQTPNKPKIENKSVKMTDVKTPTLFKSMGKDVSKTQKTVKIDPKATDNKNGHKKHFDEDKMEEQDEIIDGEEFLEDDNFELDEEEFAEESETEISMKQCIMKPEMMDEEVPSDDESRSEDGSLYDELPSSDSEDFDDWFTLDIRSERASDYLPLLGAGAGALLGAERRRAEGRVATLRESLSALTDAARRQADALRSAAMALAEIDDTLRAA
ncbi:unnamed protein product [Arctia plantaginis]|uniref:Uncharacterized protein n=1 Tax=Arctia plantaginis TaxID=874455 RepID=A0A8S0YTB7_ARCPL|nr:unnamed protein product [Arctia plantaginis]CAB3231986.1 unnamed protein product [Arctia plantaginis]